MWFGGLWGEDDAEHAGAPASASSSPSLRQQQASNQGEGGTRKAQKRGLHGFDRALAICCVCMEEKCQPVSAHVALYVYVCV